MREMNCCTCEFTKKEGVLKSKQVLFRCFALANQKHIENISLSLEKISCCQIKVLNDILVNNPCINTNNLSLKEHN